jgi:hypothetical protein
MPRPRRKPPHPADAFHAALAVQAVRFEIALFLGAGQYARATAPTLDVARVKAAISPRRVPTAGCH